jgi:hypothetical protein
MVKPYFVNRFGKTSMTLSASSLYWKHSTASSAKRQRLWRNAIYDQIREVMSWQGSLSIERLCQMVPVSCRGFYRSLKEQPPAEEEMKVRSAIQQIALEHRRRYGYRRITAELHRIRISDARLGGIARGKLKAAMISSTASALRDFDGLLGPASLGITRIALDFFQLHTMARDAQVTHVERKAMQVLVYLAEHADQVVPKERLGDNE